jgi:hypothetical protein
MSELAFTRASHGEIYYYQCLVCCYIMSVLYRFLAFPARVRIDAPARVTRLQCGTVNKRGTPLKLSGNMIIYESMLYLTLPQGSAQRPALRSAAKDAMVGGLTLDRKLAKSFSYNEAEEELTVTIRSINRRKSSILELKRSNGCSNDGGRQSED